MVTLRGRRRESTLAGQFLVLQLVVVALLLLIVGVFSVRQSTRTFTDERGSQMRSVAENVANLSVVRCQLGSGAPECGSTDGLTSSVLAPSVDRGLSLSGATDVMIAAPDGEVLAASDPSLVGAPVELGDSDVQQGRSWVGDIEVEAERAVAGHAPILAEDGELIGFAVAQQTYPTVGERLTGAASDLAFFLGLGALLGGAGTYVVSRVVKRRTRGLAPTEIANLADHREALLHSIREGVVAVGIDERVTMMNDAARVTLACTGDPVGRRVDELGLDPQVVSLLTGGADGADGADAGDVQDAVALVGTRVVVFNRRAASSRGRGIGSVTTMRDRTELVSMQSQLSSNLTITDTLRAQTHEFDNQLHTISGLVQLGEYDEVQALVGTITRHRTEISAHVSERIDDLAVAALVIAKDSVAHERGVSLVLDPGSRLPTLAPGLSADLTAILGNLVDNAVDACAGVDEAMVEVWLTVASGRVHLRVRDNGPGVTAALRKAIFVRGFSTKPDVLGGRGIGLPLVQLICTQRGGQVEVHDDDNDGDGDGGGGGGAVFTVALPIGQGGGS